MLETIKSGTEISYLFTHGKRFNTPYITFIVLNKAQQHGPTGRVAFIAGKKLGNAVWRNKAKRRLRALSREFEGTWGPCDVLFIAKRQTTEVTYSKVLTACKKALKQADVTHTQ